MELPVFFLPLMYIVRQFSPYGIRVLLKQLYIANANPKISTKMLSLRLKELQKSGLIKKNVISDTPIIVEYSLTNKGKALNGVLFHLAIFALKNHPKEVYNKNPESLEIDIAFFKNVFEIDS